MAKKAPTVPCMGCEKQPALPGRGPTRLCASCKALAAKNKRGVTRLRRKPDDAV